jgi:SHS2 domain-containing protein
VARTFEILDHTADIGIISYGDNIQQLFSNSALGLFSLIIDTDSIKETLQREVILSSLDQESLLVEWLNELLYIFEVECTAFKRFAFETLSETELRARCFGSRINTREQTIKREVKAATYHMLTISKGNNGFKAQVIFDI